MSDLSLGPGEAADYQRLLRQFNLAKDQRRLLDRQLREATDRNQKLVEALRRTKSEIEHLRLSLSQQVVPPLSSALVLGVHASAMTYQDLAEGATPAEREDYLDVWLSGRLVRVIPSPLLPVSELAVGMTVLLDDQSRAVVSLGFEAYGDLVTVREVLDSGQLVLETGNQSRVLARVSAALEGVRLKAGDQVTYDSRVQLVTSRVQLSEVEDLLLEEVPDISYEDIGGLSSQIGLIRDALELPFLHPDVYRRYRLTPPKGILLFGPPGNGKTLIAKALARSLADRVAEGSSGVARTGYFLNIKGPELLDKYVGETERQVRDIFAAARAKAQAGHPVVVFFDEMEALFRRRGSGRSSDVETTIVPQLLTEIDGVEALDNVILIGATNREDMIDPAVLRPGRLDLKIRVGRPDEVGAAEIFALYLTDDLPLAPGLLAAHASRQEAVAWLVEQVVADLFSEAESNRYLKLEFEDGSLGWLHRGQFLSGAVIRNIVDQAKKLAIKDLLAGRPEGLSLEHLLEAARSEFEDQLELPQLAEVLDVLASAGRRQPLLAVHPAKGQGA